MKECFDIIGIGFGPAGIALAAAIQDHRELSSANDIRALFIESRENSTWQSGMLLRGTDIQNHYLRDFATVRNPRSRFTFPNYLKEKGRIFEFGELVFGASGGAVSRLEWSDYNRWVADQLSDFVKYSEKAVEVLPIIENDKIELLRVKTEKQEYITKNVVLCQGRKPFMPQEFNNCDSGLAFHSSSYTRKIQAFDFRKELTFSVVGSGQNAIEVIEHLYDHFPKSKIHSIHRSIGFSLVDLCQFSNEVFHPDEVDYFHALGPQERKRALGEYKRTNYGVVDQQSADSLYRKIYEDMVLEKQRVVFHRRSNILSVAGGVDGLKLKVASQCDKEEEIFSNAVILCTGFYEEVLPEIVAPMMPWITVDQIGEPMVNRDFSLSLKGNTTANIYFSSNSERTHGISASTSFSLMAKKSETIFAAILKEIRSVAV